MSCTDNQTIIPLPSPASFKAAYPITYKIAQLIEDTRSTIKNIMSGRDKRLLVVVGPCSIHDEAASFEYTFRLKKIVDRYSNDLFIVMRTYFEKPRTTVGWRGLLSDPHLDGSNDIDYGLKLARKILLGINDLGIPTGTEFLNTLAPYYLADLISWVAIGARTSESQIHRELASHLPMVAGFKNSTDGNVQIAIDAVNVAKHPQHFIGLSEEGHPAAFKTTGNPYCHVILRGSHQYSNFHPEFVSQTIHTLERYALPPTLMIDCSHGNTAKNHHLQHRVIDSVIAQRQTLAHPIFGVMIESHLVGGKQTLRPNQPLVYGQSITDACLSWDETTLLLEKLAHSMIKTNTYRMPVAPKVAVVE